MVATPQVQQNVARCTVGMVQMYSKSVNVNDLHGFCMDYPLFAWTGPPPCFYGFSARWFAMSECMAGMCSTLWDVAG